MRYIETLHEGETIRNIYICRSRKFAESRKGKPYESLVLQDKTGKLSAKIWDPYSEGISDFDENDFVEVLGDIITFNGNLQLNIRSLRVATSGEYDPKDFMPASEKPVDIMYNNLLEYINKIDNDYLRKLCEYYFVDDEKFIESFKGHSAAKTVHHGFAGGLLEHTLHVTKMCEYYVDTYGIFNKDLLYAAALCHDIGKVRELSDFPENDYTDEGQLLGHIVIGIEMVGEAIRHIDGFPEVLALELKHCIVSHHGELEYGSPKKPAMMEAIALNLADMSDARIETIKEVFKDNPSTKWVGYQRLFESNFRRTTLK